MLINNNKKLAKNNYCRRFKDVFHLRVGDDIKQEHLFLGLADTDWRAPKGMIQDISNIVKQGAYNYCYCYDDIRTTIKNTWLDWHNEAIESSKIIIGNGVIHLIQCAIHTYTKKGDGIIVQTPGYHPFFHIVESNGRKVIENQMIWSEQENKFLINWKELEQQFKTNKFMIWCSPHNPTGRVWTDKENKKLIALAKKHNVFIASDEIWKDIVFKGHKHIPLSKYGYKNTLVVTSIGKTYNIGSLQFGFAFSHNYDIVRDIIRFKDSTFHIASHNRFTIAALKSAYTNKETKKWYKEMLNACEVNRDYFTRKLKNTYFQLSVPEGTYVYWVNFERYVKTPEQLDVMLEKLNASLSTGWSYRGDFSKWARFTFAVSKTDIKKLADRMVAYHKEFIKKEGN